MPSSFSPPTGAVRDPVCSHAAEHSKTSGDLQPSTTGGIVSALTDKLRSDVELVARPSGGKSRRTARTTKQVLGTRLRYSTQRSRRYSG
jgi:hypothetical protein